MSGPLAESRSASDWEGLAPWWLGEVESDPVYASQIVPLVLELVGDATGRVLDLGCGEGQIMRALGSSQDVGCDLNQALLQHARQTHAVVRCRLPDLRWARSGSFAAACAVLVLEHLPTLTLLAEVHRVVATGGILAVVMNHPAYTSPGSGPIVDQTDGEVLWRWGNYFEDASWEQPAGEATVMFHHRPLETILSAAGRSGWALERLVEQPLGPETIAREPGYAGQEHMPRLLGARWKRL